MLGEIFLTGATSLGAWKAGAGAGRTNASSTGWSCGGPLWTVETAAGGVALRIAASVGTSLCFDPTVPRFCGQLINIPAAAATSTQVNAKLLNFITGSMISGFSHCPTTSAVGSRSCDQLPASLPRETLPEHYRGGK